MLCNDWSPQESFFFFFLLNYVTARLISSTLSLCTLGSRYIFPHLFCSVVCKRYWCIVLLLSSDSKRSSIILRGIVKRVVDQSCSCVKCFGHVSAIYYMYIYVFCFHPVESIYGTLFMLLLMVFCVHMHGMLQPLSNQRNHLIWVELQGLWVFCFLLLFFFVVYVQCLVLFPRPYPIPVCVPELHLQCRLQ